MQQNGIFRRKNKAGTRNHNPCVGGSNPSSATNLVRALELSRQHKVNGRSVSLIHHASKRIAATRPTAEHRSG